MFFPSVAHCDRSLFTSCYLSKFDFARIKQSDQRRKKQKQCSIELNEFNDFQIKIKISQRLQIVNWLQNANMEICGLSDH